MLRSVDISDYMIHRPVKIHAEDEMSTAIGLVLDNKISGICVVNEPVPYTLLTLPTTFYVLNAWYCGY